MSTRELVSRRAGDTSLLNGPIGPYVLRAYARYLLHPGALPVESLLDIL